MTLTISHVRPGPAGVGWLASRLREAQGDDPLAPLTVVAPSQYTALHLRRRLGSSSFVNVRFMVLGRLAEMMGAARLARQGRSPLTAATRAALIRAAVRREAPSLRDAVERLSLVERLAALALELRRRGHDSTPAAPEASTAAAALAACAAYVELLAEHGLYDEVDLLAAGAAAVSDGEAASVLRDTGPLAVYLPPRLGTGETAFLEALAHMVAVHIGLTTVGDPGVDDAALRQLPALARGLQANSASGTAPPAPSLEITIAVDAVEEVRTSVRRVLAALEVTPPVALHRTAILYGDQETYGGLVRDTLLAAGLPHAALDGRPLSESIAGCGLLGLLHLRENDFTRRDVLAWLSGMPRCPGHELSPVLWDRLSRKAGVVRGSAQWQARLRRLATEDREQADRLEREGDDGEGSVRYSRRRAEQAEAIAAHIAVLDGETAPPAAPTWPALVSWAQRLRGSFLAPEPWWPEDEREAAQLVDQVLEGLVGAGRIEPDATVDAFMATLQGALGSRRRPEGRLGDGVVIGPVNAALGMSFDRVYILGMSERSFPTPAAPDPFFGGEDPLARRLDRLADERRAYLAALAAADGGVVTLSCPQSDLDGRPVYPSPWLVEAAGAITGSPVTPTRLREAPPGHARIRAVLGMVERALPDAPTSLSLSEHRTAEVIRWLDQGGNVEASPLARRPDARFGRVLEALRSRRSRALTVFDGNLETAAATSERLASGLSGRGLSSSVIQGWATCPFSHLLSRILRVESTERPEDDDDLSISPLEQGSLVHRILEIFYVRLRSEGRPRPGERFTADDHDLIELLAGEEFDAAERRGITGNRLVWENVRSAILRDLHTALSEDEDRRHDQAVTPMHFEQGFGVGEGSWPSPVLRLKDGREVRLHGYIDRVDINLERTRAQIIDYKTGRADDERPEAENLLLGGRRVQLAIYAEAVRRWAEETGQPITAVESMYWFLSANGGFKTIELLHTPKVHAALEKVVNDIDEGVRAGAFPQAPGEFDDWWASWENCRRCAFDRICPSGRDAVWERKSEDPASRLHSRLTLKASEPR